MYTHTVIKRRAFVFCVLGLFLAVSGSAASMGQGDFPRGRITVSGRVRLLGTALFPNIVITDDKDRDWYIEGEDRQKLSGREQRLITVKGTAEYRELTLANGESAGTRRILRNITIIE
jgi:hypothetical protein